MSGGAEPGSPVVSHEPGDPWLLPLLAHLRRRPGTYLGTDNVRALEIYLLGYARARQDLGLPELGRGEEGLLEGFRHWLREKLGSTDNFNWVGHVERIDPSPKNVRTFFGELEEFLLTRGLPMDSENAADHRLPRHGWSSTAQGIRP